MSTIFIAATDMFLCVLMVVIVAVAPAKANVDGAKPHAEFLIQLSWPIERNADLDLWVVGPSRKPVFYGSRQVGCADLDRDSLGFSTSTVKLDDGSLVRAREYTETTSIRCLQSGRWDVAANWYSNHGDNDGPITAHVEVTALNPSVRTVWAGDVELKLVGKTVNAVSFDLNRDGHIGLVSVPLETVTHAYEAAKP